MSGAARYLRYRAALPQATPFTANRAPLGRDRTRCSDGASEGPNCKTPLCSIGPNTCRSRRDVAASRPTLYRARSDPGSGRKNFDRFRQWRPRLSRFLANWANIGPEPHSTLLGRIRPTCPLLAGSGPQSELSRGPHSKSGTSQPKPGRTAPRICAIWSNLCRSRFTSARTRHLGQIGQPHFPRTGQLGAISTDVFLYLGPAPPPTFGRPKRQGKHRGVW